MIKKLTAILMTLTMCIGMTACSSTSDKEQVTVYTSVPQDLADEFKAKFEEKNPEVNVNIYRATSNEILTKLQTEADSGQVSGDVLWVADFASADSLKELNLLEKYTSSEDAAIDATYKDADGYYYGSRLINMVLAYNTQINAPKSWNDLTSKALANKVGVPSVNSGSAFQYVGVMSENKDFGWDFFEKVKKNGALQFKANKDVLQRIATGEILAGPVLDYMVTDMKAQGSPVDFVVPQEGAIAVASPIAKIANCKNPALAEKFIDFTLSKEGQEILASMNTTPVRTDVKTSNNTLSIDNTKIMEDTKGYLSNSNEVKSKFTSIFGE